MKEVLQSNESVAHMAAQGDVLAIAIGYRPALAKGPGIPKLEGGVVLVRQGTPPIRTPLQVGAMRAIVATPSGFVAARVIDDKDLNSTTYVSRIDLNGAVTEMPSLGIDLVGLWVAADGAVHAYSAREIFRWVRANPIWERLPLDPAVNAEEIRQIAILKDGTTLVVTDHSVKAYRSLQERPLFVKNLNIYPNPIDAYGDDHWWIVTRNRSAQKISIVNKDGEIKEVASLSVKLVKRIMFNLDNVVIFCAGEGDSFHHSSYFVLSRDGNGTMRGPFELPDDTIETCLWGDSIVSGGASNRIYKTKITR